MAKSKFTRQNVKSDIMEKVLIRIDYEGVSDINNLIINVKKKWSEYFSGYIKVTKNNYNINVTDLTLQNKTIDISDPEKQIIHRFTECKVGNPNTYMDINERFAYIDVIAGKNYVGTQQYTNIMSEFIVELLKYDSFISLTRVAIRKIDRIEKPLEEDPDMIVETPIFGIYKKENRSPIKKRYSDFMKLNDVDSIVNIVRDISFLKKNNGEVVQQIILDMDIYKQGQKQICINQSSRISDIKNVLEKKLNDPLFQLYIETFKESFIDKFYNHG